VCLVSYIYLGGRTRRNKSVCFVPSSRVAALFAAAFPPLRFFKLLFGPNLRTDNTLLFWHQFRQLAPSLPPLVITDPGPSSQM
jgi:hypothetical protein